MHVTPGDAAQSGLPMSSRQQAATQHSSAPPHGDEDDCVVCLDNARAVLFLTCGHIVRLQTARLPLAHLQIQAVMHASHAHRLCCISFVALEADRRLLSARAYRLRCY